MALPNVLIYRTISGRAILWFFLLLFTALLSFLLLIGKKEYGKNISAAKKYSVMEGLKIIGRKTGSDAWVMSAQKAFIKEGETDVLMDAVSITVPAAGMALNADRGTFNQVTNDLRLNDNITVRAKGSLIYLKSLNWNPSSETIASSHDVKIKGPGYAIEGKGFTSEEKQKLKLMKNVRATFF